MSKVVSKALRLSVVDMKALLPPLPVLAIESLEQFEKIFDQLIASLKCQDMVEMIHIRDFAFAVPLQASQCGFASSGLVHRRQG